MRATTAAASAAGGEGAAAEESHLNNDAGNTADNRHVGGGTAGSTKGRFLRVVLALRPRSIRRRVLNSEELLDFCNAWRPSSSLSSSSVSSNASAATASRAAISQIERLTVKGEDGRDGGSGSGGGSSKAVDDAERGIGGIVNGIIGASCVSYDFEDIMTSAALMKQSDVLVGMHGGSPWRVLRSGHDWRYVPLVGCGGVITLTVDSFGSNAS